MLGKICDGICFKEQVKRCNIVNKVKNGGDLRVKEYVSRLVEQFLKKSKEIIKKFHKGKLKQFMVGN